MTDQQDDKTAVQLRELLSMGTSPPAGMEARAISRVTEYIHRRRRLLIGLVSGLSVAAAVGAAALAVAVTHQRPSGALVPAAAGSPAATLSPGPSASASPSPSPSPTAAVVGPGFMSSCDLQTLSASGKFAGAAGNDGFLFTLSNHTRFPCALSGYLTLTNADPRGAALAVRHASSMLYTDPGPRSLTLAPGHSAYFAIGYNEAGICANGGPYFTAIRAQLSPGDSTVLPVGAWGPSGTGRESICDGDVQETALSLAAPGPR